MNQGLNIDHLVFLVESFYSLRDNERVIQIQQELQEYQRSDHGWEMANQLLQQPSLNCKFFGCLTYTVNISSNLVYVKSTTPEDYNRVVEILLNHLLALINDNNVFNGGGMFVIRKMISNLNIIYMYNHQHWKNPIITLLLSLNSNKIEYESSNAIDHLSDEQLANLIKRLPQHLVGLPLIFSQIFVEDIIKKEVPNLDKVKIHQSVHDQLFQTTYKLFSLTFGMYNSNAKFMGIWFDCLDSWIQYASKAEFDTVIRYDLEKPLEILISLVTSSQTEISSKAIEILSESIETNHSFFPIDLRNNIDSIIFNQWGSSYLTYLSSIEDSENINQFVRLIINFLEIDLINLSFKLSDPNNDPKFEFLIQLTNFPGVAITDEYVSKDLIDMWMSIGDSIINDGDSLLSRLKNDNEKLSLLNEKAKELFGRIFIIYWNKIHITSDEEVVEDSEFKLYRRDVGDLVESIYPIAKKPLFEYLVDNILNSLTSPNENSKSDIEASLYLLISISNSFSENHIEDDIMNLVDKLFNSKLFESVISNKEGTKFQFIIYTTIQFLSSIDWFYKSDLGLPYLATILNFLFECMLSNIKSYQIISSKAILEICKNCRSNLTELLPNFESVVNEMIGDVTVKSIIRQRITNSYASIIQSVKDPAIQGKNLFELFNLFNRQSFKVISELNSATDAEQVELLKDYLISLISSLKATAKGLQLPEDVDDYYTADEQLKVTEYWTSDPLNIHQMILQIIQNFTMSNDSLSDNLIIMEEACETLKPGLIESIPGPFVFQSDDILQFILGKFQNMKTFNSYPLLYELFGSLIRSHYKELKYDNIIETIQLIFIDKLNIIKEDPDLIQSSLTLFSNILTVKPSLIVSNTMLLNLLLEFAISQVSSSEMFVLKSLELFWTKLITLRKGTKSDTVIVQRLFNETELGDVLTYNLMKGLFNTHRSDLEYYVEIIKSLINKYPLTMNKWLINAFNKINHEKLLNNEKQIENWEKFVKKVILTRGMRSANALIKDFWLEVNGLIDYSGSTSQFVL